MAIEEILKIVVGFFWTYGPKIIYALLVLIVGFWIANFLKRTIVKKSEKKKSDSSLNHFLSSIVSISLKILVLITVASMLGIATTSFVAILGAAGLAVGLALQGSLANFAGGVLLLLFKPFKVGDYISSQGFDGTVRKIDIFNTTLTTVDNKTIIIPNGKLSNEAVTNYSAEKLRRVDLKFGVAYDDDIKKTKKILDSIIAKHKLILKDPEPFVRLGELGDSSVNFIVRVWVKNEDYWTVNFDLKESVKIEFDKAKLSIPFPQMDVHLQK